MRKIIFILLGLSLLLMGCGSSGERAAKKVPEAYMDAVKNGDNFEAIDNIDGFIDVIDYEFLKVLEAPKIKDTTVFDHDDYEEAFADTYDSFDDYKNDFRNIYEEDDYEIITDNNEKLEVWDKDSYEDVHKFLYNVEITNTTGEKVYKKAEFTVESGLVWNGDSFETGYKITEIYLR